MGWLELSMDDRYIKTLTIIFLNLPFLANFYKLTGMSQTYHYHHLLTNLLICNLFFCYSLQLIFLSILLTYFFWYFWQIFFPRYFCNLFFCYSLQLVHGQSCRIIFLANHINLFFWYFLQQFFSLIFFVNIVNLFFLIFFGKFFSGALWVSKGYTTI